MLAIVPTANRPLYTVSASEYGVLPSSSDNAESACKGGMTLWQRGAACRGDMLLQLTLRSAVCHATRTTGSARAVTAHADEGCRLYLCLPLDVIPERAVEQGR